MVKASCYLIVVVLMFVPLRSYDFIRLVTRDGWFFILSGIFLYIELVYWGVVMPLAAPIIFGKARRRLNLERAFFEALGLEHDY